MGINPASQMSPELSGSGPQLSTPSLWGPADPPSCSSSVFACSPGQFLRRFVALQASTNLKNTSLALVSPKETPHLVTSSSWLASLACILCSPLATGFIPPMFVVAAAGKRYLRNQLKGESICFGLGFQRAQSCSAGSITSGLWRGRTPWQCRGCGEEGR